MNSDDTYSSVVQGILARTVSTANCDIVVLGTLPPPIAGASKNTLNIVRDLIERGNLVAALRTSTGFGGGALKRSFRYHVIRVGLFLRTAFALCRGGINRPRPAVLYMVPDGGKGILYSAAYAKLARSRYAAVFIHHRSFHYIDAPNYWMRMICHDLDRKITHVFLSDGMRDQFQAIYGKQRSISVGNARYVEPLDARKSVDELILGHLSNLSEMKGFAECIDTFEAVHRLGLKVKLILAGPVHDESIQNRLDQVLAQYPKAIEYLGPLHGKNKLEFYKRITIFLFPTKWPQEAQPNVIYEAFAGAAPVVTFGRGLIPEMVSNNQLGLVISPSDDFVERAVPYIISYWNNPKITTSEVFHAKIEREAHIAASQYELLLSMLSRNSSL